jgi:hypothetical protein
MGGGPTAAPRSRRYRWRRPSASGRHCARRGRASATPGQAGRSLKDLTRTPPTDRERPASPWPAALQAAPASSTSRHHRRRTGPLPIDPGHWGRPAGAARPLLPSWTPLGAPPPPPLPLVRPATEEPRRSQRPHQRRGRGALIESVVAVAILLTVALVSGRGRAGGSPPVPSTAITTWDGRAVPVITQLVGDLTAIEGDTAPNQGLSVVHLRHDGADLGRDLVAAQALGSPPPTSPLASLWTVTLRQLAGGQVELDAAVARPTSTAIAQVRQQLALAGDGLLQLGHRTVSGSSLRSAVRPLGDRDTPAPT